MDIVSTLPPARRYDWGVDWITLTWPPDSQMYADIKHGYDKLLRGLNGGVVGEDVLQPVKFLGYGGWRLGKFRVGWRKDSAVLIATSYAAMQILAVPYLDEARCTRIDIKVDCHYDYPRPYILQTAYNMVVASWTGARGRRCELELHDPMNKPHWLEVGTRGVGLYIRIYDKEAESKGDPAYEGVWRIEAEIAKGKANEAFHWLVSRRLQLVAIRECGAAHFAERGLALAGERYSEWYIVPMDPRRDTDTERTLGWLRKLVRPAIARVLKDVDKDVIIDALGLWSNEGKDG